MDFEKGQVERQCQMLADALRHAQLNGVSIMGAGGFAQALHHACVKQGIAVHAFVITAGIQTECDGVPVYTLVDLPSHLLQFPLWIGVFNREIGAELTALRQQALACGFVDVKVPQEFFGWVAECMGWRFWLAPLENYLPQWPLIEQARALLADDESRMAYDAILSFRRGLTLNAPILLSQELQYFPDSLMGWMPKKDCCYVDAGAYDGDTLHLARSTLGLANAYVFEPDSDNFRRLVGATSNLDVPLVCFPLGLSDTSAFLRFYSGQGEGCAVDERGEHLIQVAALDDLLCQTRIDFLKLDVEGSELQALLGARRLIAEYRPFLAVAGYHRWDDLWRIPLLITTLCRDYKISLKIHCVNSFEAVFYAYSDAQ